MNRKETFSLVNSSSDSKEQAFTVYFDAVTIVVLLQLLLLRFPGKVDCFSHIISSSSTHLVNRILSTDWSQKKARFQFLVITGKRGEMSPNSYKIVLGE